MPIVGGGVGKEAVSCEDGQSVEMCHYFGRQYGQYLSVLKKHIYWAIEFFKLILRHHYTETFGHDTMKYKKDVYCIIPYNREN